MEIIIQRGHFLDPQIESSDDKATIARLQQELKALQQRYNTDMSEWKEYETRVSKWKELVLRVVQQLKVEGKIKSR